MGKRRATEQPPLSDYWKPPLQEELPDGIGAPIACLATTFEFEAAFFETELLPRFLGLRFDHKGKERSFIVEREDLLSTARVAVLVDISRFDPGQTTLQWDQVPIQVPGGVQHAKLTVLAWERLVRLIVTSANQTCAGYRRNRELFAALDFFDSEDSVPLNLLGEALDFLDTLPTWSRALPEANARIGETIKLVRDRIRRWSNAPPDFTPRERPRVSLVVGHPRAKGISASSVIDRFLEQWGQRRANSLTVLTPFAGQSVHGDDAVISRLRDLPMKRNAEGWLVVPQSPVPEGTEDVVVPMPQHFGQSWLRRFGDGAYVLPVPTYVETTDLKRRDLHAKAIHVQDDNTALLMIGSSNFTPHGMGVGVFNCEANLSFEDSCNVKRDGLELDSRLGLPVPWKDALTVEEVVWQQPNLPPEDSASVHPQLPRFFAWASYSQKTGEIRVTLDRNYQEPGAWSISLCGQSLDQSVILFQRRAACSDTSKLSFTLDEVARGTHIASLRATWEENDGTRFEAYLAVSVEQREVDLLPPDETRALTIDCIVDCLITGKDLADHANQDDHRRQKSPGTDAAVESLQSVETKGYLLYRARRFGRALHAMVDMIAKTPITPDAMRYRLLRYPLGPIYLAGMLASGEPYELSQQEIAYRAYALAEIALSLGSGRARLQIQSKKDAKWIGLLFLEAKESLEALSGTLLLGAEPLPSDLRRYLQSAFAEATRVLDAGGEE